MHVFLVSHTNVSSKSNRADKGRANKESGERMSSAGLIGGPFVPSNAPAFLNERLAVFNRILAQREAEINAKGDISINITLPNGDVKNGTAFKTTPYDIAKGISQGLADNAIIAKVVYTKKYEEDTVIACDEDEEAVQSKQANAQGSQLSLPYFKTSLTVNHSNCLV